ncbi:MAG: N-6 DNA methylase [candidate division WOR-3 bacterium]
MRQERTERQFQGYVLQIIGEVINENPGWPLRARPVQEEGRSDILILDEKEQAFCVIELKDYLEFPTPYKEELWAQAERYAAKLGAPYFITWNMLRAVVWDRSKPIHDSDMGALIDIGYYDCEHFRNHLALPPRAEQNLKKQVELTLSFLIDLSRGVVPEYTLDRRFIDRLNALILRYSDAMTSEALEIYRNNAAFRQELERYVRDEQGWKWTGSPETLQGETERITRLALLLLMTKLVFYHALKTKGKHKELPRLIVPPANLSSVGVMEYLWRDYIYPVINRIDYQTLLGERPSFIDEFPFRLSSCREFLGELISEITQYDFSEVPHDIIGRIFEELIEEDSRHQMGQYFTRPDIADLICAYCIRGGYDDVLDAGSGSGTFSVRAYHRKKKLIHSQTHLDLLQHIWSVEIAPYPAHLTTLNMVIQDLRVEANYPRVINRDFFLLDTGATVPVRSPDGREEEVGLPKLDAVVSNPPYTRQEEMEKVATGIKARAYEICRREWPEISISKRASLYAYFFMHAAALLKNGNNDRPGGRLGFITADSWLDVDYGKALQEMFLKHFRLTAIIDSEVERWFRAADVNTCITLAEKKKNGNNGDNLVKFVNLKVRLDELWERYTPESFADEIESHDRAGFSENRFYRIFAVKQSELLAEATDSEGNFVGAKWGKYLRAPMVYFRIMERARDKLVPLGEIASIRRGFTTGANKFFYAKDITDLVEDERIRRFAGMTRASLKKKGLALIESEDGSWHLIERIYLRPVIKSLRFVPGIKLTLEDIGNQRIVFLRGPLRKFARRYVRYGEQEGYSKSKTCSARKPWYKLPDLEPAPLLISRRYGERFFLPINQGGALDDCVFYGIDLKSKRQIGSFVSFVNSTFFMLHHLLHSYHLTGSITVAELDRIHLLKLLVLKPTRATGRMRSALKSLFSRPIRSIFEELGLPKPDRDFSNIDPERIRLEGVMPDRLELDDAVLEALGFEGEQERKEVLLELYRGVVALIKDRLMKARSTEQAEEEDE